MTSMIPFRFAIPKWLSWGTEDTIRVIDIPSVEITDIENNPDRRARTLKHLIKANHANFSVIYHELRYHNHMTHVRQFPLLRIIFLFIHFFTRPFWR